MADDDSDGRVTGELSSSDRRLNQAASGGRRERSGRRRAPAEDGKRTNQLVVSFSDAELAAIDEVSRRTGLSAGAWVGEMAVRYARGQLDPLPADWRDFAAEFVRYRVDVQRAGTVINQVARHANATGEFEDGAERLMALVERLLQRIDAATEEAGERVRRSR
ncbi:hypothetical protein FHX42_005172 [Saccharopolyspora lacisalsi]|uniref:Bacterial mobilisation domain-containing protein n=1 Tax=Halosaccharopolyspora lacisalsi TaxID=1000566 RepID=A0A839E780_9PSEU|nr:MobC family plasmid mobilization relaxosome protein [Halosaccharopolyspora lacisalsi]MBA8827765.1 hypothetical protein [Halosaccharopolyspora lacisalsi]